MHETIKEGKALIRVKKADKISKKMGVFYNPAMCLNRDISVLLLNSIGKNSLQIADPLAATGVRSIRFLKELGKNKIKNISINDNDKAAAGLIKQNLALNKIPYKNNPRITMQNQDANLFLLNSSGFDYIDIDPFGSPNFLLDSAAKRLSRNGILAVTATDTSALCGTFPKACLRKYWAVPKKDAVMHETGLRILIRKIQLVAAQYDKALTPVFSYSKEHYMRVFLRNDKGKNKADGILKQHGCFNGSGPMWLGSLWDAKSCSKILSSALKSRAFKKNKDLTRFLKIIKEESKINAVGFYDLHEICEKNKIRHLQKKEVIKSMIKRKGFLVSDTHFKGEGIRSNIELRLLLDYLKLYSKTKVKGDYKLKITKLIP